MNNILPYINTPYYAKVYKICAACRFSALDKDGVRVCRAGGGHSKSTSSCEKWEVKEKIMNAGKGGGRVLRAEYIQFLMATVNEFIEQHTYRVGGEKHMARYKMKDLSAHIAEKKKAWIDAFGDIHREW